MIEVKDSVSVTCCLGLTIDLHFCSFLLLINCTQAYTYSEELGVSCVDQRSQIVVFLCHVPSLAVLSTTTLVEEPKWLVCIAKKWYLTDASVFMSQNQAIQRQVGNITYTKYCTYNHTTVKEQFHKMAVAQFTLLYHYKMQWQGQHANILQVTQSPSVRWVTSTSICNSRNYTGLLKINYYRCCLKWHKVNNIRHQMYMRWSVHELVYVQYDCKHNEEVVLVFSCDVGDRLLSQRDGHKEQYSALYLPIFMQHSNLRSAH